MKSSAELTPAMQSELDAFNELLRKTADELESSGRMKTLRHLMAEYDTPFVNEDDMFSIFDKIPAEELNIVFASFLKKAENPHHFSFIMRYKDKVVDYHDNLVHIVRSSL